MRFSTRVCSTSRAPLRCRRANDAGLAAYESSRTRERSMTTTTVNQIEPAAICRLRHRPRSGRCGACTGTSSAGTRWRWRGRSCCHGTGTGLDLRADVQPASRCAGRVVPRAARADEAEGYAAEPGAPDGHRSVGQGYPDAAVLWRPVFVDHRVAGDGDGHPDRHACRRGGRLLRRAGSTIC